MQTCSICWAEMAIWTWTRSIQVMPLKMIWTTQIKLWERVILSSIITNWMPRNTTDFFKPNFRIPLLTSTLREKWDKPLISEMDCTEMALMPKEMHLSEKAKNLNLQPTEEKRG